MDDITFWNSVNIDDRIYKELIKYPNELKANISAFNKVYNYVNEDTKLILNNI